MTHRRPSAGRNEGTDVLLAIFEVLEERKRNPKAGSHTASLLSKGRDAIALKVAEEALEVVHAAQNETGASSEQLVAEVADLWYHTMVLLLNSDLHVSDVLRTLNARRRGPSGGL